MVKFQDVDSKGRPVMVELSPSEVVKRMTEISEYQNLFKGKGTGGVGGSGSQQQQKGSLAALAKDPKAYREARKAGQTE